MPSALLGRLQRILPLGKKVADDIICEEMEILEKFIQEMFEVIWMVAEFSCNYVKGCRRSCYGFGKYWCTERKVCGEFRQGENTTKNTTGCGVLMCGEIHNKLWWVSWQLVVSFTTTCGEFHDNLWWDRGGYQYKVCPPSPQVVVIPWAGTCSVICSNIYSEFYHSI